MAGRNIPCGIVLFFFISVLPVSCAEYEQDYFLENNSNGDFFFSLYANNSCSNQSAAVYGDYLFLVTKFRGKVHMYSLKGKRLLCTCSMTAMGELNDSGGDIYHCNQTSFGVDYYDDSDPFPVLYISQRARGDKRCFTEVFRIITNKSDHDTGYSSFKLQLVQIIYFPPQSESNSLGNVNTVIDRANHLLYTYSRNNNRSDRNYRQCKISCFTIPDVHQPEVYLEDSDIKTSFMINCSAYYMQGACIEGKYLYIARGATGVGYIDINIIDLEENTLETQLNLLGKGYRWEPEGCFYYNGHLMIATSKKIFELYHEVHSSGI